jgi:hypothetical protein
MMGRSAMFASLPFGPQAYRGANSTLNDLSDDLLYVANTYNHEISVNMGRDADISGKELVTLMVGE